MLRFLLILGIILYVLYKIGSFFFKAGAASQQFRERTRPGEMNGDAMNGKQKTRSQYKGGEYIDYEEVK